MKVGNTEPYSNKNNADKALFEFDNIAKSCGIKYSLIVGTCLGFVRGGGYISGDNDIDLALICSNEKKNELFGKLTATGFTRGEAFKERNIHFHKYSIQVDIWSSGFANSPFLSELREIEYGGRKFNIPRETEKYLEYLYGDWRVPSKTKPRE